MHLAQYAFPGNVRELENLLHRAVALTGAETIGVADLGVPELALGQQELHPYLQPTPVEPRPVDPLPPAAPVQAPLPTNLAAYLDEIERDVLDRALERYRYNRTAAGASLGLSLRQMRYRMARLGVNVGGDSDSTELDRNDAG